MAFKDDADWLVNNGFDFRDVIFNGIRRYPKVWQKQHDDNTIIVMWPDTDAWQWKCDVRCPMSFTHVLITSDLYDHPCDAYNDVMQNIKTAYKATTVPLYLLRQLEDVLAAALRDTGSIVNDKDKCRWLLQAIRKAKITAYKPDSTGKESTEDIILGLLKDDSDMPEVQKKAISMAVHDTTTQPVLLTSNEVRKLLGICKATVTSYASKGLLHKVYIGRRVRFDAREVAKLVNSGVCGKGLKQ